jgi:protein-disulfide isomerase
MDRLMSSPKQRSAAVKNRREFLELAAATGLIFTGAAGVFASSSQPLHAEGASVPVDQLMAPQTLPDIVEANASADGDKQPPVTIVEYASMTCSHCAAFHAVTYPVLLSKYVDTGKVRFVLREFPLDPLATAAFMLARCAGPDKRNAMVSLLFQQQSNWAFAQKPIEALASLVKQTGMSQESFEACLKDQDLHEKINEVRDRAAEKFGVEATPTFFFNGIKHNGAMSPDELDKLLEPLLKG